MPSEPTVPNTADNADGLHDLIRAERDEKARNLIESGEMGHDHKGRKMPRMDGDGHYANIFRAAMGGLKLFVPNISSIYSRRMKPSTRKFTCGR